jgi:hypothetical protein
MNKLLELLDTLIAYILYGSEEELLKHKTLRSMRRELGPENAKFIDKRGRKVSSKFASKVLQLSRNIETLRELVPIHRKEHEELLSDEKLRDFLILRRLPEESRSEHLNFSYDVLAERVSHSMKEESVVWREIGNEFGKFKERFKDATFFGFDDGLAQLERFSSLMEFDFASFLSQFDPTVSGEGVPVSPNFVSISANQVYQDILDLYYIMGSLEITSALRTNLEYLLEYYKKYSETNIQILRESIDQVELLLEDSLSETVLRTIICFIEFDPYTEPKTMDAKKNYLEHFIAKREEQLDQNKERLQQSLLDEKLKLRVDKVFEGEELEEVSPYDGEHEQLFLDRGFPGFSQRRPLALLKSYYTRRFSKGFQGSLRKVADEGYFENREFKVNYNDTLSKVEGGVAAIEQFRNSLRGKGTMSIDDAVKVLKKESISETDAAAVKRFVRDTNGRARRIVEENSKNLNTLYQMVELIHNDYRAKNPRYVSNLRVIAGERSGEVMKKIEDGNSILSTFVEVLKNYAVIRSESDEIKGQQEGSS